MFAGVGERTREGNDLHNEMIEAGVIKVEKDEKGHAKIGENGLPIIVTGSRIGLVYGQMNEPPGARLRVALSALALGVARRAYEHSVTYAQERKTWGQPIATRQSVAFSIADMRIELDAARLLVWEAAWRLDRGETATRESYLAKLSVDEMVLKVTDEAVMIMGGHGFIRENPVERWLRNARGFSAFEGLALV